MFLNQSTIVTILLVSIGIILAVPVLRAGFQRRGTGIKYEPNFVIQRAPQYASIINIVVIFLAFVSFNHIGKDLDKQPILSMAYLLTQPVSCIVSSLGELIFLFGLIFMIGGWYSLGKYLSTDAEILSEHKLQKSGLLKYVMHPCYSGIIQSLFGLGLVTVSPLCLGFTIFLVAPLWINRAKYEEVLLLESLGDSYREYARELKWRRIIPQFIPFGF